MTVHLANTGIWGYFKLQTNKQNKTFELIWDPSCKVICYWKQAPIGETQKQGTNTHRYENRPEKYKHFSFSTTIFL